MTTVQTQEIIDAVEADQIATVQYQTPSQTALKAQTIILLRVANSLVVDSPVQYRLTPINCVRLKTRKPKQKHNAKRSLNRWMRQKKR